MRPSVALPNPVGIGTTGQVQWMRLFAQLLGTAYQCLFEGGSGPFTVSGLEAIVWGYVLRGDGYDVVARQLAESFPDTATNTISEWERRYGLPLATDRSNAERQAALLAKTASGFTVNGVALQTAIRRIDSGAVVTPSTHSVQVALTPSVYADDVKRAQITELAHASIAAHATLTVV